MCARLLPTMNTLLPSQVCVCRSLAPFFACLRCCEPLTLLFPASDPSAAKSAKVVDSSLLGDLKLLVNNADYSDVTFIVEGRPLYAHRAMLAVRSDHFRYCMCNAPHRHKYSRTLTPAPQPSEQCLHLA